MTPGAGPRAIYRLHADSSGATLIWVSVMIFVIFGFVGLAVDGARYYHLNSNLQDIADAAAIAAAKELNGSSGAIANAEGNLRSFLGNNPNPVWADLATDGVQIEMSGVQAPKFFYYDAVAQKLVETTDDKKAAYIRVTTIQSGINTTFIGALLSEESALTRATATAKVSYLSCGSIQSFMCNPWESATGAGAAGTWGAPNVKPGDMFKLISGSVDGPGSWGLIQPADNSPFALTEFWAEQAPFACTSLDVGSLEGPEVLTGNLSSFAMEGINTRFDGRLTPGGPRNTRGTATAGPIVLDGVDHSSCAAPTSMTADYELCKFPAARQGSGYVSYCNARCPIGGSGRCPPPSGSGTSTCAMLNTGAGRVGSCPLPRDRTLTTTATAWASFSKGTGVDPADIRAYWDNQHGSTTWTYAATPTRYQVFLDEVAAISTQPASFWASGEPHLPSCNAATTAERRIVNVAIVDCNHWEIRGTSRPLPIFTKVARFFITEPATAAGEIYAEYVASADVNSSDGIIYQNVKLVE